MEMEHASIIGQLDITPDRCRADKELLQAQAKKCVTLSAFKQRMPHCKTESTCALYMVMTVRCSFKAVSLRRAVKLVYNAESRMKELHQAVEYEVSLCLFVVVELTSCRHAHQAGGHILLKL